MRKLWLYGVLARVPLLDYRGKVVAVAAVAAALPFTILRVPGGATPLILAACLAGVVLLLFALSRLLAPIGLAAAGLRRFAATGDTPDLPTGFPDEAGRLMADVQEVAGRLDALSHRLTRRHPVTGLPTREPFLAAVAEDARGADQPVVLGVIRFGDYDRLAAFDQAAADRALHAFSVRLKAAIEPSRPLAQVDRDCFAVWLSGANDPRAAGAELQAVAYVLAQDLGPGDRKISPDVALGAAVFPDDGRDPAILLTRALAALPKAGQAASGKLTFFSTQSSEAARDRFSLEQDLRQAIVRDQFLLHFQPVVDLAAGAAVGAEALLRWRHPERGLVSPGDFIPLLEESGMMEEVGLWVLNTACREARAWRDQGLTGLKMAVNLSARQLQDPALDRVIVRTLERHGLPPESLELELTETATMEDAERTRQLFGDLRALGVSVAIDDFGAGYSSLSYLKNLPFSKLKIDREFVTQVNERRDSAAICHALVELAHGLDITVLAEGVETREEVDTLQALGCSVFQGFFFSRPQPAADFVRTVTDPEWLALLAPAVHRQRADLGRRLA